MQFAMIYGDEKWISAVCIVCLDNLPHYSSTSDIHNSGNSRCFLLFIVTFTVIVLKRDGCEFNSVAALLLAVCIKNIIKIIVNYYAM